MITGQRARVMASSERSDVTQPDSQSVALKCESAQNYWGPNLGTFGHSVANWRNASFTL